MRGLVRNQKEKNRANQRHPILCCSIELFPDEGKYTLDLWLLSGLPNFSLFGFAQGLALSMVGASDLGNRGEKFLLVFSAGRRRASLRRRFGDYEQTI